eukprot:scaffold1903_cov63-Phaeocystis_antarctica.AAC.4
MKQIPQNAARRNDGTAVRRPPNAGGVQDHVSGGDNGISTGSRALLSLTSRQLALNSCHIIKHAITPTSGTSRRGVAAAVAALNGTCHFYSSTR